MRELPPNLPRWPLLLILLLACEASGQAEGLPPREPDLYPLGGLGAEGDLLAAAQARDKGAPGPGGAAFLQRVHAGEPAAKAKLQAGDLLLQAAGKDLPAEGGEALLATLEEAVEEAEAKGGKLTVTVFRGGKAEEVELKLPVHGPHGAECPRRCPKCERLLKQALTWLVEAQQGEGCWVTATNTGGTNGKVALTALAGWALAAGKGLRVAGTDRALAQASSFILRNAGQEPLLEAMRAQSGGANWSQVNWALAYGLQGLAGIPGGRPPAPVKARMAELARELAANQEASGGWGHGPGGPNALGYVELEIVSNQALLGLFLARQAGVKVPDEPLAKAAAYVDSCLAKDGGVAYSTRPGQAGHGDPGRTAGALLALDLLGLGGGREKMAGYLREHLAGLAGGHVSPVMHLQAAAMAANRLGEEPWAAFWSLYRPYLMASRLAGGAFAGRPTRETQVLRSNMDRNLGPAWTTASFALVLAAGMGRLPLVARRQDQERR